MMHKTFIYQNLSWADYRRHADELSRRLRLCYRSGTLELLTIPYSRGHLSRLCHSIVRILTDELAVPVCSTGSFTCERPDLDCAIEADESYYLTNEPMARTCRDINLLRDPPPDLAIEVEVEQSFLDRVEVLMALGVPEIWHVTEQAMQFHQHQEGGAYAVALQSRFFPTIGPEHLLPFVQRTWNSEECGLLKEFRRWVKIHMATANNPREPSQSHLV